MIRSNTNCEIQRNIESNIGTLGVSVTFGPRVSNPKPRSSTFMYSNARLLSYGTHFHFYQLKSHQCVSVADYEKQVLVKNNYNL